MFAFFSPIYGWGPSGLASVLDKRLEIAAWFFLILWDIHCGYSVWNLNIQNSGQGRSPGHVSRPSFNKVRNHVMATVYVESVWNFQDCMRSSVPMKCTPRNLYGDLRSGQLRDLPIICLLGNMIMPPVSHKATRTTKFCQSGSWPFTHLWRSGWS